MGAKILNFLLIFFLVFFAMNLFMPNEQAIPKDGLQFEVVSDQYKIPANIKLNLANYSDSSIALNTCGDIDIRHNGAKINISDADICKDIELSSGDNYIIDYGHVYNKFGETGKYDFSLEVGEYKVSDSTELEVRGLISKLFIAIFYQPAYNLLMFLIGLFNNSLGYGIIGITIIARLLLLFPQHRMLISQKKMQAIQPKVKEIQEKHKKNPQQAGIELMALYKKEGVNPVGSLGFLFLQMPILLVLYNIIASISSYSNEFYLYSFMKDYNVLNIDTTFFGMDLLGNKGTTGIILGLLVGGIQMIQVWLSFRNQKISETAPKVLEKKVGDKSYTADMPDPQKIMKNVMFALPVFIGVMTYFFIAGLGIYWGISTIFAIVQQIVVNKIIKK